MVSEENTRKNRDTYDSMTRAYSCEYCLIEFEGAKEMVEHYKENHPDSMESLTLPN